MVMERNMPSVKFLVFISSSLADHSVGFTSADIHELTEAERTHAQEVFLEDGPTPRLCIDFVQNPPDLTEYYSHRTVAIDNLDFDTLVAFVRKGELLDMELSHSIILVKRKNADNLHEFTIEPITLSIKRRLK